MDLKMIHARKHFARFARVILKAAKCSQDGREFAAGECFRGLGWFSVSTWLP